MMGKSWRRVAIFTLTAAAYAGALAFLQVNPVRLITDLRPVQALLRDMWPPNVGLLWNTQSLLRSVAETIAMAFLGTAAGCSVAIVLSLFAAANTTPSPALRSVVRFLLATERSMPNFAVLLILLVAVGIGPFAGVLALSIGSIGMFGKLFADAIEQVDAAQVESVQATGASASQTLRFGILPQAAPSLAAALFYAFDVNLRLAVALGVFGAGGIGFQLQMATSMLRYRDMLAYLIIVVTIVILVEKVADALRRRLFGAGALR